MRCVIRHLQKIGNVSEYRDETVDAESITIGRSLEQDIVLPGNAIGLRHARLSIRSGNLEITTVANNEIQVNGQDVVKKQLVVDDVIQLGSHTLKLIASPPGFDAAFELVSESVIDEAMNYETRFKTSLSQTRLNKRLLSWILGISFLLFGLLIPWAISQLEQDDRLVLPSWATDTLWLSGPLVDAHSAELEKDCISCHETPFQMVRNSACDDCHQSITQHSEIDHPLTQALNQQRCAICHKEHNEPSTIIDNEQSGCIDCHANLDEKLFDQKTLKNVNDFDDNHPDFTLTLLVENPDQGINHEIPWIKQRQYTVKQTTIAEQSNLKFNHKVHMDSKGVESPAGDRKIMLCQDCHALDAAGMSTKAITMNEHCEECHQLSFDPRAGDFKLPHGSVEQVIYVLEGFYQGSRMGKSGIVTDNANTQRRRARRPGQRLNQLKDIASDDPKQRMNNAIAEIFERTTCIICHLVKNDPTVKPQWIIKPVKLNDDWMPKSYFNHKSHSFKDCVDCHEADASKRSQDILMPDIKNCRDCHSDNGSDGKLTSVCIDCHRFHIPGFKGLYNVSANIDNE